ncbi:MAG: hypothetical protein KDC54_23735 [Lewinella sp.]|nr:hypothetical protein [Lewinella sp.]
MDRIMNAEQRKYYRRWLLLAPAGLILVGFGACLIAESAMLKAGGAGTWTWVGAGTGSLIVFNSGLCLFGDAILQRMRYERLTEIR